MKDWADEKATEWLRGHGQCWVNFHHWAVEDSEQQTESLSRLLREAAENRNRTLRAEIETMDRQAEEFRQSIENALSEAVTSIRALK